MNEKLLYARLKKGWSQEEAAAAAQVSIRTYQRWEHDEHIPNFASRRLLQKAFAATNEELGFDLVSRKTARNKQLQIVRLADEELAALVDLLGLREDLMDEPRRSILNKLLALMGMSINAPREIVDAASWVISTNQAIPKRAENGPDLDLIDSYVEALRALLAKGEAQYVMHASQNLYSKLLQVYPFPKDIRLAETQLCLGMLIGASQEYALPWYQRATAVMQTYNHIEEHIIHIFGENGVLHHEYVRLLAKRGRQQRVLWQFDACKKACEDGLSLLKKLDDYSLLIHFLCERAHIEATRGDEPLWMRRLEEAQRGALDIHLADREKALNQVNYMRGEGYKRFAFHTRKELSLSVREGYAKYALHQFAQWNGASIELPGFEALVVQVSKAQCFILLDPDEAIHQAEHLQRQAEQNYPALLDKIHRVAFLAQQRLQMNNNEFLQMLKEPSTSAYHMGRNIL